MHAQVIFYIKVHLFVVLGIHFLDRFFCADGASTWRPAVFGRMWRYDRGIPKQRCCMDSRAESYSDNALY